MDWAVLVCAKLDFMNFDLTSREEGCEVNDCNLSFQIICNKITRRGVLVLILTEIDTLVKWQKVTQSRLYYALPVRSTIVTTIITAPACTTWSVQIRTGTISRCLPRDSIMIFCTIPTFAFTNWIQRYGTRTVAYTSHYPGDEWALSRLPYYFPRVSLCITP